MKTTTARASGLVRRKPSPAIPQVEGNADLQMWLRLLACANLVSARLRHRLRADFGVTLPNFDILAQIARPPLGPTMGELSRRLMVSKGNVTELVERLTQKGLVMRSTDSEDARIQRVYLTAKGQALFERVLPAHNDEIRALIGAFPRARLAALSDSLGELKALLRRPPRTGSSGKGPTPVRRRKPSSHNKDR
jgi:DNA-binding MarR family transcriptional regulator